MVRCSDFVAKNSLRCSPLVQWPITASAAVVLILSKHRAKSNFAYLTSDIESSWFCCKANISRFDKVFMSFYKGR